jgi:hypothetical protein
LNKPLNLITCSKAAALPDDNPERAVCVELAAGYEAGDLARATARASSPIVQAPRRTDVCETEVVHPRGFSVSRFGITVAARAAAVTRSPNVATGQEHAVQWRFRRGDGGCLKSAAAGEDRRRRAWEGKSKLSPRTRGAAAVTKTSSRAVEFP